MIFPAVVVVVILTIWSPVITTAVYSPSNHWNSLQTHFHSLLSSSSLTPGQLLPGLNLLEATVEQLNLHLNNHSITSVQLVNAYLFRIDKDNHKGLNLRAVIETAPRDSVLAIADALDRERAEGKVRSPMHGIPILIKDNIATDIELGMNTTAGSFALLGSRVPRDAHVVALLREAGAIILGKASISEWANFRGGPGVTNGWSARGGQTSSAYVVGGFAAGGDPSGSSSGSAVGVSAGFAPIAVGTETDGSIISPAEKAALFGIKPTVGLTSRAGIIPISPTQDSPGPMAKSVYDLAVLLTIMAGHDPRDPITLVSPPLDADDSEDDEAFDPDYTTAIIPDALRGLRIGIPRYGFYNSTRTGVEPIVYEAIERLLIQLKAAGAIIIEDTTIPTTDELMNPENKNETIVLETEFKVALKEYFSELNDSKVVDLEGVINYNDRFSRVEMPEGECCQEIFISSHSTTGLLSPPYLTALSHTRRIGATEGLTVVFATHALDVLLLPAAVSYSLPAIVGWPVGTVPLGYHTGLSYSHHVAGEGGGGEEKGRASPKNEPFGVGLIVRPRKERMLIRVMGGLEGIMEGRRIPEQMT